MIQIPKKKLTGNFHESRTEIATEGVKALLIVNGGAAIALLTFLQYAWEKDTRLLKAVLISLALLATGVLTAACVNFFRYLALYHAEFGTPERYHRYLLLTLVLQCLSLLAFASAIGALILGAWPMFITP